MKKQLLFLCLTLVSHTAMFGDGIDFVFNPAPSESIDYLLIPYPEPEEISTGSIRYMIERSTNLTDWHYFQGVEFERIENDVKGFLIGYNYFTTENGTGFEGVFYKRNETYTSDFGLIDTFFVNDITLSHTNDSDKRISLFIGGFTFSIPDSSNEATFEKYTPRETRAYFRLLPWSGEE